MERGISRRLPRWAASEFLSLVLLAGSVQRAPANDRVRPGPLPHGGYLLTNGWQVRPAGKNLPLSTCPLSQALSPDGRVLAVMCVGYAPPTISTIDLEAGREIGRTPLHSGWRGLVFSPSGDRLYAGNGGRPSVSEFSVDRGLLSIVRTIDLFPGEPPEAPHLIGDILCAGGKLLVTDTAAARIVVVDLPSGRVLRVIPTVPQPYALLLAADAKSVFASSWSTGRVAAYRLEDGAEVANVAVGAHPTEMAWLPGLTGAAAPPPRLAVACANTNDVDVVASDGRQWGVIERITVSLSPGQPVGMTPSALSLRAGRLYVACSDANAIGVVDVSSRRSKVLGFIPTGWYPTSVRALPDGGLVAVNGKGLRSFPNSNGLTPYRWPGSKKGMEHVALMQTGSISLIADPNEEQLAAFTRTAIGNSPYDGSRLESADSPPGSPIPSRVGGSTPLQHVILLTKEMRTYDQILGDMPEGNGDRSKVQFGERITPNHHRLAREFALLDNFYCAGDIGTKDGLYWTTAAIAPDSTQRTWPMALSQGLPISARFEAGPEGLRAAPGGAIWDRAAAAKLSFSSYGINTVGPANPRALGGIQVEDVLDPVLKPHTNLYFPGHDPRKGVYDFAISDVDRIGIFLRDLAGWEKQGEMPRLVLMSLCGDHTSGMSPGKRSPNSCLADNDQALGLMVEAVTHSRFWSQTAICVLWNDSQDGNDHVDSHRAPAYVISPYSKRGVVDSTFYNTLSMLRTIELILGLEPMTVFDAAARPMAGVFQASPDLRPYRHEPARVPVNDRNPPRAAR